MTAAPRTFKPRRRALSPARAAAYERLAPRWCLDESGGGFDAAATFGRAAPLVLDIGIGAGEALVETAAARPDVDAIGADVHTPGIAATLDRLDARQLGNVRLVHGDALVFAERLSPRSLTGIRIWFPDPWPKARHRGRRLVSEVNVDRLVELLAPAGTLHVATDIVDYAAQTARLCDAHPDLEGGVVDRPEWRPVTRYERKALAAGRPVVDLIHHRVGAS